KDLGNMQNYNQIQFSQINSPTISLLECQNIPLVDESDIQFVHYNKNRYFDSQILSREEQFDNSSEDEVDNDNKNKTTLSHAELRRQLHIKSEQKRRAEIKDAFEELRKHLPDTYTDRKMSKSVLLQKGNHSCYFIGTSNKETFAKFTTIIVNFCKAVLYLKNSLRKENILLDEINCLNQNCVYLRAELKK
ncbi:34898_t:CDS:2, partial [Gigaspora margarita]